MKKSFKILIVVIVVLIGLRIYLPFWLTDYVNKTLDSIPGYTGSISGVSLSLYRGAYQIHDLDLRKLEGDIPVPFVSIREIDLSVQWKALFKGSVVGEIVLKTPQVNFVAAKTEDKATGEVQSQTGEDVDWTEPIKELIPLKVNLFAIENGEIHFRDFSTKPEVDLYLTNISARATNLTNVEDSTVALPSNLDFRANVLKQGTMSINGGLNVLLPIPEMDLEAKIENVSLPDLNNFTKTYAWLDFSKGEINVYSEIIVKDNKMDGYVKPLITDIKVVNLKEDAKQPLKLIWESIAGVVIEIFENQKKDQFATRVPLQGDLSQPGTNVWNTIGNILKNAFIQAFRPQVDDDVAFENE